MIGKSGRGSGRFMADVDCCRGRKDAAHSSHKTIRGGIMRILAVCGLVLALTAGAAGAAEPRKPGEYPPTADSLPQPGVAKGKLIGPLEFHSKIIEGTVRRYWIYVP